MARGWFSRFDLKFSSNLVPPYFGLVMQLRTWPLKETWVGESLFRGRLVSGWRLGTMLHISMLAQIALFVCAYDMVFQPTMNMVWRSRFMSFWCLKQDDLYAPIESVVKFIVIRNCYDEILCNYKRRDSKGFGGSVLVTLKPVLYVIKP